MIWDGDNAPSERIQDLLQAFHCFIQDNHKGNKDEDVFVREQWQKLKRLIQDSPVDVTSHQNHIDKIKMQKTGGINVDIKLSKSVKNIHSMGNKSVRKQVSSKQLQKFSSKLVQKMKQNNRKYIK